MVLDRMATNLKWPPACSGRISGYETRATGNNTPNWRTHIFQRGSNHQPNNNILYGCGSSHPDTHAENSDITDLCFQKAFVKCHLLLGCVPSCPASMWIDPNWQPIWVSYILHFWTNSHYKPMYYYVLFTLFLYPFISQFDRIISSLWLVIYTVPHGF